MKQKNKLIFLGLVLMIGYALVHTSQTMAVTKFTIQEFDLWLNSKITKPPEVNVTGKWDAGRALGGGWGEANLIQKKSRFSGTMGFYDVKGVVSGTNIYLVILSRGSVYYTGWLSMKRNGRFFGKTAKGVFVDSEEAKTATTYPIKLRRMR